MMIMSSPSELIVNQQHQRLLVSLLLYSRFVSLLLVISFTSVLFSSSSSAAAAAAAEVCDIETGQTNVIVDIDESRWGAAPGGEDDWQQQTTRPRLLPIVGDVDTQMSLQILSTSSSSSSSQQQQQFTLVGKELRLSSPLDRDERDISSVIVQVSCTDRQTLKRRNIPVIVRISDVNDNRPQFVRLTSPDAAAAAVVVVPEDLPIGSVVFPEGLLEAKDADAGINALVEYKIVPSSSSSSRPSAHNGGGGGGANDDGYGTFHFASPHQPIVTLVKPLDYESVRRYTLTVVASDRAFNVKERLSSTVTLTVDVSDVNDEDPAFVYRGCPLTSTQSGRRRQAVCETPTFTATVSSGGGASTGGLLLNLEPSERIQAVDTDSPPTNKATVTQIRYSLVPPSDYFEVHPISGWIRQIRPVNEPQQIELTVKATEKDDNDDDEEEGDGDGGSGRRQRSSTARLVITVKAVDAHVPRIVSDSSSFEGIVEENSPKGTAVTSLSRDSMPMKLRVVDDDLQGDAKDISRFYSIELTSPLFRVNAADGIVQVAADGGGGQQQQQQQQQQLDRDPPNPSTLTFQAIARPLPPLMNNATATAAMTTAPVTISIRLTDVNDNSPRFPPSVLKPIMVPAGQSQSQQRIIGQVQAEDKDSGDNGRLHYSLVGGSSNKFAVDSQSGVITAVAGSALNPGEKFILSIQAMDGGGRSTLGTVQVVVVSGPNTQPPTFAKELFEISVSEAAGPGSLVYSFQAQDPEKGAVFYSIVSGNELGHFGIDRINGTLSVVGNGGDGRGGGGGGGGIDREQLSRYTLAIKAEDADGLFSMTRATIRVLDVNDSEPQFVDLPYVFNVRENGPGGGGGGGGSYVGRVQAKDADQDMNARVTYSIAPAADGQSSSSSTTLFIVDSQTGELRTTRPLDYEKERVHRVVVTAVDGGRPARQSTATVTVMVVDVPGDLKPRFQRTRYEAQVAENGGADVFVAQVETDGRERNEESSKVTYTLRQGDGDKFSVDPSTGVVRTKRPLDYERQSKYVLVIGTLQNTDASDALATTTLIVNVQDRNDFAPVFSGVNPRPVRLQNTAPIGQLVTTVSAIDSDATAPNNQIRYELVAAGSSARAAQFFRVDPLTGVVSTRDNLRKDSARQYQLEIRASDYGQPTALSSSVRLTLLVEQVEPPMSDDDRHQSSLSIDSVASTLSSLHFSEMSYAVSVAEDALVHTLIKNLSVSGGGTGRGGASPCVISSGNDADVFYIKASSDRHCELRLKRPLDYETVTSYSVVVRLDQQQQHDKATTRVDVNVIDVNDNSPRFVFKYPENRHAGAGGKYYAALASDASVSSILVQVHAEDADSGALGGQQLVYDIMEASNPGLFFSIERSTGKITTDKMINTIGRLPLRLVVTARDNPGQPIGYRETSCQVVVNVIHPANRLVIVVPSSPPDQVLRLQSSIIGVLQDETRLIVRLERLQARSHVWPNGTLHVDESGSELWFYCIDPATETILESNHSLINRSLLDMGATKHLIQLLANKLKLDVTEIRPPLASSSSSVHSGNGGGGNPSEAILATRFWEGLPAALVVVAVLVFLLALGGIIYLCATWDNINANGGGGGGPKHPSYVVFPSFNPLAVVQDPNPKEYETQILQLSVNNSTDESINSSDFTHHHHHFQQQHQQQQMITRRSHVFPGGGGGGGGGSSDSDIATLRISSLAGSGNCEFAPHQFFASADEQQYDGHNNDQDDQDDDDDDHHHHLERGGDGIINRHRQLTPAIIPTANPLYEGSDEDPLNYTSATNTNVTFRPTFRSKLSRLGIPEISTEL